MKEKNMKKRLIESAEKCFNSTGFDQWWGNMSVTRDYDAYIFVKDCVDYSYDAGVNVSNEDSVWFLLVAAYSLD